MKKLLFFICLTLFCISCEKDEYSIENPDVEQFVRQLKNGTYNKYKKGESGENLWLQMPDFTKEHIPSLIYFAKDTSHITHFPPNPISSRSPLPLGRDYFILGECLLWTVEGIRNGSGYGSLNPNLIDSVLEESERYKGLSGSDILIVRDHYQEWWNDFKEKEWKSKNPLEGTSFVWF